MKRILAPSTLTGLLLFTMGPACSDGDTPSNGSSTGNGMMDMGPSPGDTGGGPPRPPVFQRTVLDGLGSSDTVAGDDSQARIGPDGQAAVAYVHIDTSRPRQSVRYVAQTGPGVWDPPEEAAFPGRVVEEENGIEFRGSPLLQIGFDFVNGVPTVAYRGGAESEGFQQGFPSNLMRSVRAMDGTWNEDPEPLVANSAQAQPGNPCPPANPVCDFGDIVGTYVAARSGPGGRFAVAYRDQHQEAESEVSARADLEVYLEGPAGVQRILVDPARNAPYRTNLAFTPDGRVVVAYRINASPDATNNGLWVSVEETDGSFSIHRVSNDITLHRIGLDVSPNGRIALAYHDDGRSDLVVATSDDGGETWTIERPDQRDETGFFPDLLFDSQGREVIAYTYCGRTGDDDCGAGGLGPDSEVRIARREGGDWNLFSVDDGQGFGFVGSSNSLVIYPDGRLGVAFKDERNSDLVFAEEVISP